MSQSAPEPAVEHPAESVAASAPGLPAEIADRLKRTADGLVCAVVQRDDDGEVLMVGWMDEEALQSGGQRQRIALARAIVRRPRLLVLDDATSAVDPHVEQQILAGLREGSQGSTVVVIAYRRATIALADEVVHVDRGRVVDRGTHADLMVRDHDYRTLVTAYDAADAADERGAS